MGLQTGHTYERANIEAHLARSKRAPVAGIELTDPTLMPNIALRKAIESNQPHGSSGVSSGGREALEEALKAAEACGLDRSQSHEGTAGDGESTCAPRESGAVR